MSPRTLLVSLVLSAALSGALHSAEAPATARLTLDLSASGPKINRNIYGQFTEHLGRCVYEGIWVGEDSPIPNTRGIRNDVVAALKKIQVPQVRWPGGCFADEYHWRDGIGPKEQRPSMINTHWGGVVENNHFGTHEFLDFCEQIGAEPYICLNVGSGTVQEAMEWVEYMTSDADSPMANLRRKNGREQPWRVPYIAIGNENWGCGGNMTAEYYADNYRRFNTYVKNYRPGVENRIQRIACGPNEDNYAWTDTLMKAMVRSNGRFHTDGIALHYYTLPSTSWQAPSKGSATQFGEDQYFSTLRYTLRMQELIEGHVAIMNRYDPENRVALVVDEWGVWTDVEPGTNRGFLYQQDTLRNAIVAALNLHIFQANADRVTMANIAQMINVLQAMILTDKEKMLLTPTYHVFEMFKVHQDATAIPLLLTSPEYVYGKEKIPAVSASASRDAAGKLHLSFTNANPQAPVTVECKLAGLTAKTASGRVLTAGDFRAHNTFANPHAVAPSAFSDLTVNGDVMRVTLPAKSVVVLEL